MHPVVYTYNPPYTAPLRKMHFALLPEHYSSGVAVSIILSFKSLWKAYYRLKTSYNFRIYIPNVELRVLVKLLISTVQTYIVGAC